MVNIIKHHNRAVFRMVLCKPREPPLYLARRLLLSLDQLFHCRYFSYNRRWQLLLFYCNWYDMFCCWYGHVSYLLSRSGAQQIGFVWIGVNLAGSLLACFVLFCFVCLFVCFTQFLVGFWLVWVCICKTLICKTLEHYWLSISSSSFLFLNAINFGRKLAVTTRQEDTASTFGALWKHNCILLIV